MPECPSILALLAGSLESAACGVVITDRAANVLWVNQAFAEMSGYGRDEAVGRAPGLRPFGEHTARTCCEFWRTVLAGSTWSGRLHSRRKDGARYDEDVTVTPLTGDGGRLEMMVAIHSVPPEHEARSEDALALHQAVARWQERAQRPIESEQANR